MSYKPRYDRGDWITICDACGRKYKASELRQRWDGLMTCSDDWEPRQPQDFVRGVADYQAPKWTRPEQSDSFIPISYGSWFINLITSTSNVTLDISVTIHTFLKNVVASVASTVTLITSKFAAVTTTKTQINGSTINKTTLG